MPVSKLTVSESYENYMSRSYQVTKDILSDCKNTGKRHTAEHLEHLEHLEEVVEPVEVNFSFIVLHAHVFVHC